MAALSEVLNFSSSPSVPSIFSKKSRAHHQIKLDWTETQSDSGKKSKIKEGLLVGPADRYNVSGLLTPHVLARTLELSKVRCAGLVRAEQTGFGGFPVQNYGERALEMGGVDLNLIHFGGNSITENIVDAYADVTSEEEAERFESLRLIGDESAINSFVKRRTGQLDDLAYLLAPEGEFFGCRVSFHSVGVSGHERMAPETVKRLVDVMKHSDFVGVQDTASAEFLEGSGVNVNCMPSALSILPRVCARQLRESRDNPAIEEIRHRFPNGWIAVEVGNVKEQDSERLRQALKSASSREGLGLVFFDTKRKNSKNISSSMRRWVKAYPEWEAAEFASSNIWDVASLILHSRLFCGGCLDCRVIAMAGAVPRISVPGASSATRDYCELWEGEDIPVELREDTEWNTDLTEAMRIDLSLLKDRAQTLEAEYFSTLAEFAASTGIGLKTD